MVDNHELKAEERLVHLLQLKRVSCFAISADGKYVAGGSQKGEIRIWQLLDGALVKTIAANTGVRDLAFSPNGERLAAALTNGTIEIWNVDSALRERLDLKQGRLSDIVFLPDSRRWVTATGSMGGKVKLWTLAEEKPHIIFDQATSPMVNECLIQHRVPHVYALGVSPNGSTLAVALWSGVITMDMDSGGERAVRQIDPTAAIAVEFSHDGDRLAIGMGSSTVWVLTADLKQTLLSVKVRGLSDVALSPDGKYVAAACDFGVKNDSAIEIYRVRDGTKVSSFVCHSDTVRQIDFAPNGQLVSCGLDGSVRVWTREK
ncbi:MAG: hypothetical protein WBD20_09380 [Pirellulaceae bacterium]